MSERIGWWKFHRKIWDNPYMNKPAYLAVWCWLLSEAQWQEGKQVLFCGKKVTLIEGQLTCGRKQIANATGVPSGTVYRILETLKNEQQIEQQVDNKKSLITILKWQEYQGDEQQVEQQVNNKRAASEQQVSTTEEVKKQKKLKNPIVVDQYFEQFWTIYDKKVGRVKAEQKFGKLSEEIKLRIIDHVKRYVIAVPEKQYRKNPMTYLNQEAWNDEIIIRKSDDSPRRLYAPPGESTGASESMADIMARRERVMARERAIKNCGKCKDGWIKTETGVRQCDCVIAVEKKG